MRLLRRILVWVLGLAALLIAFWMVMIGPVAVWRVITHGTTTVWDHLAYPGRQLSPSPEPQPWTVASVPMSPPQVTVEGVTAPLDRVLAERDALSFLVVADGEIVYEWYAPGHGPHVPSMLFSVSKSILSLLVGAAIDDGVFGPSTEPVSVWVPELGERGFDYPMSALLAMRSGSDYVENDNPFGVHVAFNYTDDLEAAILGLASDEPQTFRYKSGDYAVLGLALQRALDDDESLTSYLQRRLWDPLGAEYGGVWSTDTEGGLERVWCCLATTARDLARFGQLALDEGVWGGEQLIPAGWIDSSFQSLTPADEWEADSPFAGYGYGWWLTGDAAVGYGKDGQYLYVDPARRVVVVRLGESQGGIGWVDILAGVAEAASG